MVMRLFLLDVLLMTNVVVMNSVLCASPILDDLLHERCLREVVSYRNVAVS